MVNDASQADQTTRAAIAAKIVEAARSQLGVPYVYGGVMPGIGFDCSGLVQWCFAQVRIWLPRGSTAQFLTGPRVTVPLPGMLAFFYGAPDETSRPGHVGIVSSVQPLQMIDAPYTGVDVRYDDFVARAIVGPMDFYGFTDPASVAVAPAPLPPPATLEDVKLRVLSEGCKGYDVKSLQILLKGYFSPELEVDADFGPLTQEAVMKYQRTLGYTVDGIVGAQTWRSILGAPNP